MAIPGLNRGAVDAGRHHGPDGGRDSRRRPGRVLRTRRCSRPRVGSRCEHLGDRDRARARGGLSVADRIGGHGAQRSRLPERLAAEDGCRSSFDSRPGAARYASAAQDRTANRAVFTVEDPRLCGGAPVASILAEEAFDDATRESSGSPRLHPLPSAAALESTIPSVEQSSPVRGTLMRI